MKIGAFNYVPYHDSLDVAVLAKRAEELGFDSFWLPEHPIIPVTNSTIYPPGGSMPWFFSQVPDPLVALARVSAVTKTIKLGTGVILVPERNPLLLAKEIATLDHFSGGRFIFGIGSGWLKEETEIMGGNFPHRWAQTRDAILAMKELWTKDEAEYHGEYYDFPPVRSFPKPMQKPHPPILLGGKARNVFKWTVAWADGWVPVRITPEEIKHGRDTINELAVQAGRDPSSIQVVAFFVPADREALKAYEEAGADAAIIAVETESGDEALAELEQIARKVL